MYMGVAVPDVAVCQRTISKEYTLDESLKDNARQESLQITR